MYCMLLVIVKRAHILANHPGFSRIVQTLCCSPRGSWDYPGISQCLVSFPGQYNWGRDYETSVLWGHQTDIDTASLNTSSRDQRVGTSSQEGQALMQTIAKMEGLYIARRERKASRIPTVAYMCVYVVVISQLLVYMYTCTVVLSSNVTENPAKGWLLSCIIWGVRLASMDSM